MVPSLPDDNLRTPPWIVPWLRARFLPADVPRPTAACTSGEETRSEPVASTTSPRCSPSSPRWALSRSIPVRLSPAAQVRAFAEAELVVGAHGAGLTNLAFCPVGATVIELFAADYVNECFWALANTVHGLRYRYLVGDGLPDSSRVSRTNRGVASDIRVDPRQIVRLLQGIGI